MATLPNARYEAEPETIELTVSGQKINEDLTVFHLPGDTLDFFVAGGDGYVVQFEHPGVFGTRFAVLGKGNNLFVKPTDPEIRVRIYSQAVLVNTNPGGNVSTTVIVIPPPPPRFPLDLPKIVGPGPQ
jgi:hypothetical protein